MTALLPASLRSSRPGVVKKADLGYITIDEQIKKSCLAQASGQGEKAEAKEKGTAKGSEIAGSLLKRDITQVS